MSNLRLERQKYHLFFTAAKIQKEETSAGKFPSFKVDLPKCLAGSHITGRCEGCAQLDCFLKNDQLHKYCITVKILFSCQGFGVK